MRRQNLNDDGPALFASGDFDPQFLSTGSRKWTNASIGTTGIAPDAIQLMHIYRVLPNGEKSAPVYLDQTQSQLLNACLHQLAQNTSITWANARQAVLRAFYKMLISSSQPN